MLKKAHELGGLCGVPVILMFRGIKNEVTVYRNGRDLDKCINDAELRKGSPKVTFYDSSSVPNSCFQAFLTPFSQSRCFGIGLKVVPRVQRRSKRDPF
jgi:hypothetical protein